MAPPKKFTFFSRPKIRHVQTNAFREGTIIEDFDINVGHNTPSFRLQTFVNTDKNTVGAQGFIELKDFPGLKRFSNDPLTQKPYLYTNKEVNEITERHINKTEPLWRKEPSPISQPMRDVLPPSESVALINGISPPVASHLLKRQKFSAPPSHVRGVLKFIADRYPHLRQFDNNRNTRFRTRQVIRPNSLGILEPTGGRIEEYYRNENSGRGIDLNRIRKGNHPYDIEK